MKWTRVLRIAAAAGIAAAAAVLGWSLNAWWAEEARIERVQQTILLTERLSGEVWRADAAQRSYLLLGTEAAEERFRQSITKVNEQLQALQPVLGSSREAERWQSLQSVIRAISTGLNAAADLRRTKGFEAATEGGIEMSARFGLARGMQYDINSIQQEEANRLDEISDRRRRVASTATAAAVVLAILGLGLAVDAVLPSRAAEPRLARISPGE
jgi:CHASE3 domain sensor protein